MLLLAAIPSGLAYAQVRATESGSRAAQASEETRLFEIRGLFDAGFRWTDVTGNNDKYREDLNYRTGPRLFNVDLSLAPTENGVVDLVNIYANQLGDPYESLALTVKKFSRFNFRYRRHTSAYFYRDIILPVEASDPNKSNGGDFHHFNFDRVNDRIDFDMRVGQRGKAFLAFNRQTRLGDSTTTRDISRDEFELDQPISEIKNDYTVGFQQAWDTVSVYVDQTYRDFENDVRLFLPGASLGENQEDAAELFFYNQLTPFDFTMPQSTARVNIRPTPRLTITGGFIYSDLNADFSHQEASRGISFQGQPFDTVFVGAGELQRTTKVSDIDVAYDVTDRLALIGGLRFNRFDQNADAGEINEGELTTLEISTDILEVGAQVFPARGVTLTGGFRYEERTASVLAAPHDEEEDVEGAGEIAEEGHEGGEHVTTERKSVFVSGTVTPSPRVSLMAEYERGDYNNPFTLIAPTALDRIKARVRIRPMEGLAVTGVFYTRRIENDLAGGIHPTEPRLRDPARLDTTDLTLHLAYSRTVATVFGGYTRREIDNEVVNLIDAGGVGFLYEALYQSDLDRVFGGTRIDLTSSVAAGTDLSYYRNRGSFGLDWEQYRVYGEVLSPAGYLFRVTYQYNALDEQDFDFDDYGAHMVTTSVGYRF